MYVFYLNLENYIHSSWNIDDLPKDSYVKTGNSIFIKNLTPKEYGNVRIQNYIKIPAHYTKEKILILYPELHNFKWPCSVGRYEIDFTTIDVIFGKDIEEMKELRTALIDPKWNSKHKTEYLSENYGLWSGWTYNLNSSSLAYLTMQLIENIPSNDRNPLRIARHITAMTDQSNNSYGILYGKWENNYKNGKEPWSWRSVGEIMDYRFYTGKPVKYAQCWIFAEVLTAMFKFLGIPARTIYAKNAHIDTGCDGGVDYLETSSKGDKNLQRIKVGTLLTDTNEFYFDSDDVEKGDSNIYIQSEHICLPSLVKKGDRIWNFHVWSECFLERNDIYSGKLCWNICDPCPIPEVKTNTSDDYTDKHFFGPCSIYSIKEGLKYNYDFEYLHSAINSIIRQWCYFEWEKLNIIYPYKINYQMLVNDNNEPKKVELYVRDPEESKNFNIIKKNITSDYRYDNYVEAYAAYHRNYPLLFALDHNNELKCMLLNYKNNKFLIQIIYLVNNSEISKCYRKIYDDIKQPIEILAKDKKVNKISTLIINLDTNEFYPQILI